MYTRQWIDIRIFNFVKCGNDIVVIYENALVFRYKHSNKIL